MKVTKQHLNYSIHSSAGQREESSRHDFLFSMQSQNELAIFAKKKAWIVHSTRLLHTSQSLNATATGMSGLIRSNTNLLRCMARALQRHSAKVLLAIWGHVCMNASKLFHKKTNACMKYQKKFIYETFSQLDITLRDEYNESSSIIIGFNDATVPTHNYSLIGQSKTSLATITATVLLLWWWLHN